MTARAFLIRGLLAGLIAGLAAFTVAYFVGEPQVQTAIELEESGAAPAPDPVDAPQAATVAPAAFHRHDAGESHDEEGTTVSRHNQRTWGLLTGNLGVGVALGGLVGLVSGAVVGRLGRWTPGQSTAFVALAGFVAVSLVPFLKYPATPPAVGNGETIGDRTSLYFIYLVVSIAAAVAATALAQRLWRERGTYVAVLSGIGAYLLVVVVVGLLMPTVNEIGSFPGDVLWYFRRASIMTLGTMWAVIGVALTGLVGRLYQQSAAVTARRELAASL